jgi:POT family proton-dependent oligopeptide transporter
LTTTAPVRSSDEFLGHPKGLYVCFLTEMWERFAFYGMKALLMLYLVKHHGFADADGFLLLGTYAGLAYALPLLGGMLADRYLGMRKAVLFGGGLLVLGQLGMAWTGTPAEGGVRDEMAIQVMYASLALIAMGVGFLKPNISTIVGRLYAENDPRRDSGFSIFYMGINIGAFAASIIVGYVGETIGWGYGFALGGVMMAAGLVQFVFGQKHLMGQAEPADPAMLRAPALAGLSREWLIYLGALVGVVAVWQVLQTRIDFAPLSQLLGGHEVTLTELVAVVAGAGLYGWFVWLCFSGIDAAARNRMILLLVLTTVSALFWGLYEQTYGPWVTLAERAMDRTTFGIEWTAGQTTAIGALCVILMSPFFAWLWPRLERAGLNPGYAAKFAWALVFCGASFGVLAYAAANPGNDGLISLWWLILAYVVLVLGEMVLSPIGLAAVTALSIPRVVSTMMGAWFLFSAFGEMIAGRLATFASIEPGADGVISSAEALAVYGPFFLQMMWIGLGAGLLMMVTVPLLNRLQRQA